MVKKSKQQSKPKLQPRLSEDSELMRLANESERLLSEKEFVPEPGYIEPNNQTPTEYQTSPTANPYETRPISTTSYFSDNFFDSVLALCFSGGFLSLGIVVGINLR
jgi:hypothetical protein